ncbi:hypothetical protein C8J57DRAFT_1500687 [Mycena rebaudengoi]|nr:hypothetical protein C8J57DRAFT_1500687 [Mycena rebaudengoi]
MYQQPVANQDHRIHESSVYGPDHRTCSHNPRFTPLRLEDGAPYLTFREVFDVPRLQKTLRKSVLEWHEDPDSELVEEVGCWDVQNVWKASGLYLQPPPYFRLDISYTAPPHWVYLLHDGGLLHMDVALGLSDISQQEKSPEYPRTLASPQDREFSPLFGLVRSTLFQIFEYTEDFSPAWRFVGQYIHWAPQLQELADSYTRQTPGIEPHEAIPPYATVHGSDFEIWCDGVSVECFAPLSAFVRRVEEVKAEFFQIGITVDRVIVTSDERDSEWWAAVDRLGWVRPDHSKTVELYGQWYRILIDAAIHSKPLVLSALTDQQYLFLSRRRVSSWQNGTSGMVWGKSGSDDH